MTDGGLLAAGRVPAAVPGFVTDVFGLLLLLPPVRGGVRRGLGRRFTVRTRPGAGPRAPGYLDVDEVHPKPPPQDRLGPARTAALTSSYEPIS